MPSKKVIYIFLVLLLVVVGWLWYLGREPKATSTNTATSTKNQVINVPSEFAVNWPIREGELSALIEQKYASGTKPKELELTQALVSRYTRRDLKISADVSTSSLEAYGKELGIILSAYGLARENELNIVGKIYDTQDLAEVKKLASVKKLHQEVLANLLKTSVPASGAEIHLSLINNLSLMISLLTNMESIATEPILALQSAQTYQLALIGFYSRLSALNDYFRANNISFDPGEQATIFINTR